MWEFAGQQNRSQPRSPNTVPPSTPCVDTRARTFNPGLIPIRLWALQGPQTSLKVGQPGDGYEQEAERVSREAMRAPSTDSGQQDAGAAAASSSPHNPSPLPAAGAPLDTGTRSFMEERLGHDFGSVRVHADGPGAEAADQLSARAFTVGAHVAFAAGRYAPGTAEGKELLAHELTHVVQQGGGRSRAAPRAEGPEGDLVTPRIALSAGPLVQRQEDLPPGKYSALPKLVTQLEPESCWAAAMEAWLDIVPGRAKLTQDELIATYASNVRTGALDTACRRPTPDRTCFPRMAADVGLEHSDVRVSRVTKNFLIEKLQKGPVLAMYNVTPTFSHAVVIYGVGRPTGQDVMVSYMDPTDGSYRNRELNAFRRMLAGPGATRRFVEYRHEWITPPTAAEPEGTFALVKIGWVGAATTP
jgi:hypothetical protein